MDLLAWLKGEEPGIIESILHYENAGQYGEWRTEYALTHDNLPGRLVVLKNIYVPMKDKTTELDLLMLHEKGIFVFESKNYSGWIFGDADGLKWTQRLQNGQKNRFYNPIRQNRTHIKALAAYLRLPVDAFTSYIVFSERCTLKKVPENTADVVIVRRPDMLNKLRAALKDAPVIYTEAGIQTMADQLRGLTEKTAEEKQRHIDDLQNKCPFCGAELVLRKGKYGPFWGCSTYPKCRFTRPEKEKHRKDVWTWSFPPRSST